MSVLVGKLTTLIYGDFYCQVQNESKQKRPPWQEVVFRIDENCGRLSPQGGDLVQIDYLLNHADIIYVGGGDTAFMMETWKKYRLDRKLKNLYLTDQAVLSGISAGAMCWFNCGHSDSSVFWNDDTVGYGWVNGLLDIFPYVFCPHYDERVESFDEMMKEKTLPGLALESNVAFVENGGCVSFVASDDSSKAYIIRCVEGNLRKQEQKIIYL